MPQLNELTAYLNQLLGIEKFNDYCPNGLQVEGRAEIKSIMTGVTACQALIDAAVAAKVDVLLVHHGYFWKGEEAVIAGMKRRRIKTLLDSEMSLVAYHLPLDAHAQYGNNMQLAKVLDLQYESRFVVPGGHELGFHGILRQPMTAEQFAEHIGRCLQREPLVIPVNSAPITSIGWCTGAAQDFIEQAANLGLDAYLSGEVSERTVHTAREMGIHYFAAGHHATERYGVQALGEHLVQHFNIQHQFVDIDNPV